MKLYIKEGLDSSIPDWLKNTIVSQRGFFGKTSSSGEREIASRSQFGQTNNLDLETTTYHELPLPRTSREFNQIMSADDKVAVMRGEDENGYPFVYAAEIVNPRITHNGKRKFASDVPVKYLIDMIRDFGYLEVSPDVKLKRAERNANKPMGRNRNRMDSYGYDKSGYPKTSLQKYIDMLGELGLSQYESILEDGFNAYDTLNSMLRKFRDDPDKILDIKNMTNNFLDSLRSLQVYYNDLNEPDADRKYGKYSRNHAKNAILALRKQIKDMKAFLDNEIMY